MIEKFDLSAPVTVAQMAGRRVQQAFKYGIDCDIIQGGVLSGGIEQGLHEQSTTKNYILGTRRMNIIAGVIRTFRYGLALDNLVSYHGCGNSHSIAMAYEVLNVNQIIGDEEITVTEIGFTKNQLKGGSLVVYGAGDAAQNRIITGNEASGATTTKIYFAGQPLTCIITAGATGCELFHNPYSALTHVTPPVHARIPIMGVPGTNILAGSCGWIQNGGPCVVSGSEDLSSPADNASEVAWASNYGVMFRANLQSAQLAGYILENGAAVAPQIQLTMGP